MICLVLNFHIIEIHTSSVIPIFITWGCVNFVHSIAQSGSFCYFSSFRLRVQIYRFRSFNYKWGWAAQANIRGQICCFYFRFLSLTIFSSLLSPLKTTDLNLCSPGVFTLSTAAQDPPSCAAWAAPFCCHEVRLCCVPAIRNLQRASHRPPGLLRMNLFVNERRDLLQMSRKCASPPWRVLVFH